METVGVNTKKNTIQKKLTIMVNLFVKKSSSYFLQTLDESDHDIQHINMWPLLAVRSDCIWVQSTNNQSHSIPCKIAVFKPACYLRTLVGFFLPVSD